ncbi:rhomboid family intramembrane serine protease [Hymenobacter sp.]|jgi:membrane associated rhomboid family serine protease|uniref:rhomboid family intramembrane serine protease n=1 Tax=Hymenobacter sp. TaxID=1898978 RepID=UPI002ED89A86
MLANFRGKLHLIFLPVLALGSLLMLLIAGGYWLLTVRLALFDPSSSQLLAGILGLSIVGLLPLLYRRLHLLWRGSDDRWVTLYYMVPMVAVGFSSLFLLDYVQASTGLLTALRSVRELPQQSADTYYFTLRECYPDRQHAGAYTTVTSSGKHDEYVNFELYVACPLLPAPTDTTAVAAWLGLPFRHQISSRLSNAQKEKELQSFLQRSQNKFNEQDLTRFTYLTRVSGRDDGREFQQAVLKSPLQVAAATPYIVLQPEHGSFAARAEAPRRHLAWALEVGWGVYLLMMLFPQLSPTAVEQWQRGNSTPGLWEQATVFLRENPRFRATPLLVFFNLVVYLAMVIRLGGLNFRTADLLAWGGSYGPLVRAGEYWRLVAPMFLHGGFVHILYNLIGLSTVGYFLEPQLGSGRFAIAYLLTGIAGTFASLAWAPEMVSVGASGAIFGLIGLMLGLVRQAASDERAEFLVLAVLFGLPGLAIGFFSPATDNAGHLGGLLGGILLGLWWKTYKAAEISSRL